MTVLHSFGFPVPLNPGDVIARYCEVTLRGGETRRVNMTAPKDGRFPAVWITPAGHQITGETIGAPLFVVFEGGRASFELHNVGTETITVFGVVAIPA